MSELFYFNSKKFTLKLVINKKKLIHLKIMNNEEKEFFFLNKI